MTDATRRIDVTSLPEGVVSLIDALGPGDELVITRNGTAGNRVRFGGHDRMSMICQEEQT